ncbi:hypothetical protein PV327_007432 [Microctonus hyperodae]|uniref:Uncharacterized protein n=1 Tax=Microctonus hyperodae TaxID=165561 RepID=A0AA39KYG3_MICHY|nr:hypothetical protein PV327_007432 [Microctonus hyperodae]
MKLSIKSKLVSVTKDDDLHNNCISAPTKNKNSNNVNNEAHVEAKETPPTSTNNNKFHNVNDNNNKTSSINKTKVQSGNKLTIPNKNSNKSSSKRNGNKNG